MANHRRSVEKEAYWRGQIDGQSASGLSIRRWCRDNEVSEPTFYVWRRELRKRDAARELPDRDLAERGDHEQLSDVVVPRGFIAVDVVASDSGSTGRAAKLEIDVAGGVVIRLREDASAETLERVLTVVCRHCAASVGGAALAGGRTVRSC